MIERKSDCSRRLRRERESVRWCGVMCGVSCVPSGSVRHPLRRAIRAAREARPGERIRAGRECERALQNKRVIVVCRVLYSER